MTRLSVLLVNDQPPGRGSGVEVHLARVVRGLERSGHRVEVCTARPKRGWSRATDLWDRRARPDVRVRARDADVVHVHNFLRELSPAVLGAAPDVPLVVTVHDHRLFTPDRPHTRNAVVDLLADTGARATSLVARRAIRRQADAVIAVSDELSTRLRATGIAPLTVLPPFADTDPEPWSPPTGHDVVYAGRLSRSKGLDELLDAFVPVTHAVPDARLRLVGTGPDEAALRAHARALDADVDVVFEGLRDEAEVRVAIRGARVACLPSLAAEGFPQFVVEALLVGRPVVASDLPSIRAALRDGRDGVLVPAGDVAALADALVALLRDDDRAADLGHAARDAAEPRFGADAGIERLVATYHEAIRCHG